jgi:hypothetical protein
VRVNGWWLNNGIIEPRNGKNNVYAFDGL